MDAIAQVIEDWSRAIDEKQQVYAIFFDFNKAFDMVDHEHLLQKISIKKQLPNWLISWLAAYLQGRRQREVFGDIQTEWKQVKAGVIQGSVLGPVLFILFIIDINELIPDGTETKNMPMIS